MFSFGFNDRNAIIDTIGRDVFDVVIVGGGITGAGIARDAALRGLKTALIERSDFSIGTSSRSSKLVHGGLRYLRNGEFGLVHESTTERNLLTSRLAPNLVRPLPFLVPVWKESKMGLGAMGAALFMYDTLGEFGNYRFNRPLSKTALLRLAPALREPGLRGGFIYYDSITDDTRLTIETIKDAVLHGAVAASRVGATSLEFHDGRVEGVVARDMISGSDLFIRARSVIVATGIWSSETGEKLGIVPRARLAIRPTRGSHIVLPYEKFPIDHAVTMAAPRDGRAMFVIPWNGMTVLGTTDTDHEGDMMDVFASRWDVDYLLESGRHNFQGLRATADDIVGTWSGLRPLIASAGSESSVSREHSIVVDDRGIVTIAGGKLTTYRVMAAQALKAAAPFFNKRLGRQLAGRNPLACSAGLGEQASFSALADRVGNLAGLDPAIADGLVTNYGLGATEVADIARGNPALAAPLVQGHPFIGAEIVYAARREMAITLEDALLRRTPVFFLSKDEDGSTIDRAAAIMAAECGWDAGRARNEADSLKARKARHLECIR